MPVSYTHLISVLLEQKGFKIEGDRLVKIKSEAPKSDAAEAADAPKSRFSAAELRQKLGEKLYKAYQKAEELIARVKTMADYEKAKAYIQANFNKFSEVMTDLLDRLKAKARSIGLKFKKAVDDVNAVSYTHLDVYKRQIRLMLIWNMKFKIMMNIYSTKILNYLRVLKFISIAMCLWTKMGCKF